HLERHEPGAAVLEERRLNRVSPGPGRHESHRDLAVDLVAHAERTGVGDVRMLEQAIRDLERGDVDPALDDDVLLAAGDVDVAFLVAPREIAVAKPDRKSTRLNSSHVAISYAVFCLKKKNELKNQLMGFATSTHEFVLTGQFLITTFL